jgi:hypothetical protein
MVVVAVVVVVNSCALQVLKWCILQYKLTSFAGERGAQAAILTPILATFLVVITVDSKGQERWLGAEGRP